MRLIRGGPGAGKTALVFRELKHALHAGEPARLIVPTSTLVRHFQHELARDGEVFPPGAVISLARFAAERAAPLKPIPGGLLRAVVRDILRRNAPAEFESVSDTEGMASTLIETIAHFENAGATPEKLAAARKLKGHAKAFAALWPRIAERVREAGYSTRGEILRAAAANTQGLKIWFDGFATFSPLEIELLRALTTTCAVTVTTADSASDDDFRRTVLQWRGEEKLLRAPTRRPEISAIGAASPEREADEIARRIVELRAAGTAFGDIAVGVRDAESWHPLLRATFERFGIPARYYFTQPLRHHPAAVFLGGIVRNVLEGWEFGSALETLGAHPRWGAGAAFDRFDFKAREAMPGRGAEALLALCEDDRLKANLTDCFAATAWALEKRSPALWAQRLRSLGETLYRPGTIDPPRDFAAIETLRLQAAALRSWIEAVETVVDFWRGKPDPISLEAFWTVASEAIDSASVPTHDDRRDVVHVMHVYEVRQWDVATLFLCGMTDRDFPKNNSQNLLFPDPEIDSLRRQGIPLRKAADLDREEDALFASLKGRARTSLVLSWSAHDGGGRRTESSRFVAELIDSGRVTVQTAALCRPTAASEHGGSGVSGRIDSPDLLPPLAERHREISLTALEDLAQCRFKFFAGRTLGLKDRPERPQERLQPRVTGLILHQALEDWLNNLRQGDFTTFFDNAFERACRELHLPPGYRLEVERMEFRKIAGKVTASEAWSTSLPSQVEVELTIDFPGGILVKCRIDRIDQLNARDCIIVDYKSSRTARVEGFLDSPVKLQGPLYALAARERLGLNTVAMMYHAVREDKHFGWGEVPGAALELRPMPDNWAEDAKARAVERISGFLSGEIHAQPVERGQCRWCDFADACRFGERAGLVMIEGVGSV
jgi:ATP-dependent helicase/DNAse subunit B